MSEQAKYPEHEKLRALGGKNQETGDFLEWLKDTKRYVLALHVQRCEKCEREWDPDSDGYCKHCAWKPRFTDEPTVRLEPSFARTADLLAEYYGIDQARLEAEKRAMLDALREANSG